jgi:hypothetical protein
VCAESATERQEETNLKLPKVRHAQLTHGRIWTSSPRSSTTGHAHFPATGHQETSSPN